MTLIDPLRRARITFDDHGGHRASELAASLGQRTAIYLDRSYWTMVCDASTRLGERANESEIARLLDAIVLSGIGFCPIEEHVFSELMGQAGPAERGVIAEAVAHLSLGVTFITNEDRLIGEAEAGFAALLDDAKRPVFNAWTKLAYVLALWGAGASMVPDGLGADDRARFLDEIWDRPLAEVAVAIDAQNYARASDRAVSRFNLTGARKRHAQDLKSFDQVREGEFQGVSEFIAQRGKELGLLSDAMAVLGSDPAPILSHALREMLKKPETARMMPTAHVEASLHALYRFEFRATSISSSDLADFRHASAALGRCKLMLTSTSLRRAIRHKRITLDTFHGCAVASEPEDAVHRLRQLLTSA